MWYTVLHDLCVVYFNCLNQTDKLNIKLLLLFIYLFISFYPITRPRGSSHNTRCLVWSQPRGDYQQTAVRTEPVCLCCSVRHLSGPAVYWTWEQVRATGQRTEDRGHVILTFRSVSASETEGWPLCWRESSVLFVPLPFPLTHCLVHTVLSGL